MLKYLSSVLLFISFFVLLCSCADVSHPKHKFPELDKFQSIMGKVVFVQKRIYGGDLEYNAILRGKVKNISWGAYRDVYIIWAIYSKDEQLFPVSVHRRYQPSVFFYKIEYLGKGAEAEFVINLDLYRGLGEKSADNVKESIMAGREEAGIFILKK
jgi:hypothetical protein